MDLNTVNKLLEKQDGNHSEIYFLIKDRINDYPEEVLCFAGEFLFFEKEYLLILKHILENNIQETKIVDIGCQFGFQTELFLNYDYLGIDHYKLKFFNAEKPNINYVVGTFPNDVNIDLNESIVISCMSLGYFNKYIDESKSEEEILKLIANKLSKSKHLYIATTPELIKHLKEKFKTCVLLEKHEVANKEFPLYYFTNKI